MDHEHMADVAKKDVRMYEHELLIMRACPILIKSKQEKFECP